LAAGAEVTLDSSLPAVPTGLLASRGAFFGGTVLGETSYGTVYQLVPPAKAGQSWTDKFVYVFDNYGDQGGLLVAPLISDKAGNLFGSTFGGGVNGQPRGTGNGTLFKLIPPSASQTSWSRQVVYLFQTPVAPQVKLAMDASGNLYLPSGSNVLQFTPPSSGSGTYTMTPISMLTGFMSDNTSSVILDRFGKIYGVAQSIGTSSPVYDIIYQLTPPSAPGGQWTSRILQSFAPNAHVGQLGLSPNGRLFGTTNPVGVGCAAVNCAVFELVQGVKGSWTTQIVHSFAGDPLGVPASNLAHQTYVPNDYQLSFAAGGLIYGGILPAPSQASDNSTIYRLTPPASGQSAWTETALYTFQGAPNGFRAGTPMTIAGNGAVYGTAYGGQQMSGSNLLQSIAFKIVGH